MRFKTILRDERPDVVHALGQESAGQRKTKVTHFGEREAQTRGVCVERVCKVQEIKYSYRKTDSVVTSEQDVTIFRVPENRPYFCGIACMRLGGRRLHEPNHSRYGGKDVLVFRH